MRYSSAWQAHKKSACASGCYYCKTAGTFSTVSLPAVREAARVSTGTIVGTSKRFLDRLGKLLRSTRGAR